MSNLTINQLPTASTIDGTLDLLPIYTSSLTATQSISRNTYLGIASQPVGRTDIQTLTNKTLTSPTISGPVLSGTLTGTYTIGGTPTFPSSVVTLTGAQTLTNKILTSPTINSPTITNASLTADSISGFSVSNTGTIYGIAVTTGTIGTAGIANAAVTSAKVSGIDKSLLTTDSNPYKFSVYRNAAQNSGSGASVKINFDTELFDTNNNFDSTTNYRYTAPVSGFYHLMGRVDLNSSLSFISLYKNGTEYQRGTDARSTIDIKGLVYSNLVQLTAGDYVELWIYDDSSSAISVGLLGNYFSGFLVTRT